MQFNTACLKILNIIQQFMGLMVLLPTLITKIVDSMELHWRSLVPFVLELY